jgi:hypothetical protein
MDALWMQGICAGYSGVLELEQEAPAKKRRSRGGGGGGGGGGGWISLPVVHRHEGGSATIVKAISQKIANSLQEARNLEGAPPRHQDNRVSEELEGLREKVKKYRLEIQKLQEERSRRRRSLEDEVKRLNGVVDELQEAVRRAEKAASQATQELTLNKLLDQAVLGIDLPVVKPPPAPKGSPVPWLVGSLATFVVSRYIIHEDLRPLGYVVAGILLSKGLEEL